VARVHALKKLLTLKIVYYGPGLSGKTTNLLRLHADYPAQERGDLVKLDTDTERTLFFDYFPANLGSIGQYRLRADFFTVPGQSFYNATRRAVLEGVDGVVFVADSAPSREEANVVTVDNMVDNLATLHVDPMELPMVFQWNKRDVPGAIPERILSRQLNRFGAAEVPAVAKQGDGVWETQAEILRRVIERLRVRSRGKIGA